MYGLEPGVCPSCNESIEYVRFGEIFPCSNCNVVLKPMHDCYYEEDAQDYWCEDWLEIDDKSLDGLNDAVCVLR